MRSESNSPGRSNGKIASPSLEHTEARSITAVEMGDSEFEYSDEEYGNVVNSSLQQAQVRARPTRP